MTPDTAPEAITQADREDLAAAAERAGCKVVPSAIRRGEATLISTHIALDALTHRRLTSHSAGEGLREAAAKVVEDYDTFSGDPHCDAVRDVMAVECAERIRAIPLTPPSDAGSTTRSGGEAIPAGMKPWAGGRDAPDDWDGGPVFYANGVMAQPLDQGDWQRPAEIPLVAYTPIPSIPSSAASVYRVTAEMRDMANVGRALMEALPEGYSYNDCPSEIVTDLMNERDDALAGQSPSPAIVKEAGEVERLRTAARHALTFIENRFSDLSPEKRSTVEHLRAALSASNAAQEVDRG